jgi:hypothetical protein
VDGLRGGAGPECRGLSGRKNGGLRRFPSLVGGRRGSRGSTNRRCEFVLWRLGLIGGDAARLGLVGGDALSSK